MLAAVGLGFRLFQYNVDHVVMMMVGYVLCYTFSHFFSTWLVVTRLVSGGRFSMSSSHCSVTNNQVHSNRRYYTVSLSPTDHTYTNVEIIIIIIILFFDWSRVHNYYIDNILKFYGQSPFFVHKKASVTTIIFLLIYGVSVMQLSEPKGIKAKMKRRILRSGVNWQGALKQKAVKQT
jgi:hypothetical protein